MADEKQNNSNQETKSGPSTGLIVGIIVAVIAVFAVGFFVLSQDEPEEPPEVEIAEPSTDAIVITVLEPVDVRSGPGTDYPIYGVAPEGAQGELVGVSVDGLWWAVNIPTDIVAAGQGWVPLASTQAEETAAEEAEVIVAEDPPPPVEVETPDPDGPIGTAMDIINIRSGPGVEYFVYGVAPTGTQGEIIGVSADGGWWVFKASPDKIAEGQAWASADWIVAENVDNVPVVEAPPLP